MSTNKCRAKGPAPHGAVGVIPARWASQRFPGKCLALLCGKPMIEWVVDRAREARYLQRLIVATDDKRIREFVETLGVEAVMTRPDHVSGTDRVAEAVQGIEAAVVVNIQGDEPLLDPRLVDSLAQALCEDESWDMATAASPLSRGRDLDSASVVKVVTGQDGRALYFSRAAIPHVRDAASAPSDRPLHWRHIGLYAYRRAFLQRLVATPPAVLEQAEKLEQLRALSIGARIRVLETADDGGIGVDTPQDVPYVEAALRERMQPE